MLSFPAEQRTNVERLRDRIAARLNIVTTDRQVLDVRLVDARVVVDGTAVVDLDDIDAADIAEIVTRGAP